MWAKIRKTCVIATLCFILTACSQIPMNYLDKDIPSQASAEQQNIELSFWVYPATGMEDLLKKYEKLHPNIKIDVFTAQYEDVHNNLQTAFASGFGAPDICFVEVSFIERFKAFPDYFYNLADFGALKLESQYLDWKWRQASGKDGKFVFGLPTDIGPMAVAYRPKLFGQAGLPTHRDEIAENIKSWDDFLAYGKQINDKTGKAMFDNIHTLYRIILGQADQQYFDKDTGKLIIETNPGVKKAWNYAIKAHEMNLSAGLTTWEPEWGSGLANGDFAVMLSASWMLNYMKGNAPEASGQWDITSLPEGSGNWGGSFLTLPKEGKHPKEAFELIKWLTDPQQQLYLYNKMSNFPSTPGIYDDPQIQGKTDPYFGDAPVGKIFADAARIVKPVYEGPKQHIVTTVMEAELYKVDRNEVTPEQAWKEAMDLLHKQLKF